MAGAKKRFWYAREPAAFRAATQHYDLETAGAYSRIIDALNEMNRPLPDEPRFIAGLLNCPVQRWRKIRSVLLKDGKLILTDDGKITNPRFEREAGERGERHTKAVEDGRLGGEISAAKRKGQLDFDLDSGFDDEPKSPESSKKVATNLEESSKKVESLSKLPNKKSSENNASSQPPPQAPRARENQSHSKIGESPHTSMSGANGVERPDLLALFNRCCDVAGIRPTSPSLIASSFEAVARWNKAGIDFDLVVIPAIEGVIERNPSDRTLTLERFDKQVLHDHASARILAKKMKAPPAKPILDPDGEDEMFRPVRKALFDALGDKAYCLMFNRLRFVDGGKEKNRRPLRLEGPDYITKDARFGSWRTAILKAASPLGFTDVW